MHICVCHRYNDNAHYKRRPKARSVQRQHDQSHSVHEKARSSVAHSTTRHGARSFKFSKGKRRWRRRSGTLSRTFNLARSIGDVFRPIERFETVHGMLSRFHARLDETLSVGIFQSRVFDHDTKIQIDANILHRWRRGDRFERPIHGNGLFERRRLDWGRIVSYSKRSALERF